jgi:hypothetical protein
MGKEMLEMNAAQLTVSRGKIINLKKKMNIELHGAHFYTLAFANLGLKNLTHWSWTSVLLENLFGRTLEGIELELFPRL